MQQYNITVYSATAAEVVESIEDDSIREQTGENTKCFKVEVTDTLRRILCAGVRYHINHGDVVNYRYVLLYRYLDGSPAVTLATEQQYVYCNIPISRVRQFIPENINIGTQLSCYMFFNVRCKIFGDTDIVVITEISISDIERMWLEEDDN